MSSEEESSQEDQSKIDEEESSEEVQNDKDEKGRCCFGCGADASCIKHCCIYS